MASFVFNTAVDFLEGQSRSMFNKAKRQVVDDITGIFFKKTNWKKDKITGKLSELSIQTSTYNKIIPNIYGTNKIAGNIIWMDEVKEVQNNYQTSIQVSKGNTIKQNNTEYFYFLNFAIAICANEIKEIKNIWANGDLLKLDKFQFRVYNGTESQLQDPLIKNINPKTPAFKGITYLVFENFPLSSFGNRIPNFIFEVVRKDELDNENNIQKKIKGINLFPLVGNFLYNITEQSRASLSYEQNYFMSGKPAQVKTLNKNNNSNYTDSILSLNQFNEQFINCEYFCISSTFFGDNKNINICKLLPRVEFNFFENLNPALELDERIFVRPNDWSVASWDRFNSKILSKDNHNNFIYQGGTPDDAGIKELFSELKKKGKKTIFCPNIYFDLNEKSSGKDLFGDANDINNFFTKTNGYNEFILHYAFLLKGLVDVFYIGNELSGLTCIKDQNNIFPAVEELKLLANYVRNILGDKIKISYSAGYKEYHNFNSWYNLDRLWSDQNINFIGIKAFFPLTYDIQDNISKELIKNSWTKGEGYDYITNNKQDREPIEAKFAYKNIKYWWENDHINPNKIITEWIPKSKKIWFTEYGFSSIDGSTNEPSIEGDGVKFPLFSNNSIDFFAQKIAIEAMEEFWENSEYIENKILSYWDLRPWPYFPNKTSIWKDGELWKYNYCVNGKINITNANNIIYKVFEDANLSLDLIETIQVDESVDGIIVNNNISVKDILYILQKTCFFDCVESFGKIKFLSNKEKFRNNDKIIEINYEDLIEEESNNEKFYIKTDIIADRDLPKKLSCVFIDKNNDYDANIVYSIKNSVENGIDAIENLPVVLDEERARSICETTLNNLWVEKNIFKFSVNLSFLFLEPSDIIKLNTQYNSLILKIINTTVENNKIIILAKQFNKFIFKTNYNYNLNDNLSILKKIENCDLIPFELPSINNDLLNKINIFFAVKKNSAFWNGSNLYFSNNFGRDYTSLSSITTDNIIGEVITIKDIGHPYYFDKISEFKILFDENITVDFFKNVTELEIFNGENLALIGNEIIQYQNIILNEDSSYTIKNLLRGLFGTEDEIKKHKLKENFILLKNNFLQELYFDKRGSNILYNIVNFNEDISNGFGVNYVVNGNNLRPLRPCHVRLNSSKKLMWDRIDRGNINWIDNFENDTVENEEKYYLEFYNTENELIKKIVTNDRFYILEDELRNFSFTLKLYQINKIYGYGKIAVKLFL